ncbi:phosphatidylserine decarboxylase domain-containing protein [Trichoderma barbatum]
MTMLAIGSSRLLYGCGGGGCYHPFSASLRARRSTRAAAGRRRGPIAANTGPIRRISFSRRGFSSHDSGKRQKFSQRLGEALRNSKITWYQIPVGLGICFLGLVQFYNVSTRERKRQRQEQEGFRSPKPRPKVRPDGPWQVRVMSTLPLKAFSRLWGWFNELTIPYYLRVPGFKLYSFILGVNLDEVSEPDLHVYPNLAAFFYRTLKPGVRPLDPDSHVLLSPSDSKVLQFGQIESGDIKQVKGMTYSIDALLGKHTPTSSVYSGLSNQARKHRQRSHSAPVGDEEIVKQEEEFARPKQHVTDESHKASSSRAVSEVRAELALGEKPWYDLLSPGKTTSLYYAVIYLAPGDYHRFHSPTNWVVESRRHFAGELYSVSPYLQRTLPGLLTLNERVVLLGRWRWGFFSYVPVGATNVGSIKINFDRELRTNSLLTDTAADLAAEEAAKRGEPYLGFAEATYKGASSVLHGYALRRGEEMGGFRFGSTIVLVFEAPATLKNADGQEKKRWEWAVEKGQKLKMGQALGRVLGD